MSDKRDEYFLRLEEKIDDISEHLWNVDKKQLAMNTVLEEHQRRSTALEAQVTPMLELKAQIKGCINLVYVLAAIAAVAEAIRLFMY